MTTLYAQLPEVSLCVTKLPVFPAVNQQIMPGITDAVPSGLQRSTLCSILLALFLGINSLGWGQTGGSISMKGPSAVFTWNGSVSTSWSKNTNWTPTGVPGSTSDVTLPASKPRYPVIVGVSSCKTITINSGALLTINSGGKFTVTTSLDNQGPASSLIVNHGGSLITWGSVSGLATVNLNFTGNTTDWHLVSSPISDATANVFIGRYLQKFDPTPVLPATPIVWYSDNTSPSTPLTPMEGYALYSTLGSTDNVSFVGSLNYGDLSHDFYLNGTAPDYGWNLMGNPYPSSVDWEAVSIDEALMTTEVHYIRASDGNDLSYVQGTGGTGSEFIPPMQGFFISALDNGTLLLGDAQRSHSGANNFYKSDNPRMLVLQADGQKYSDQTIIHFNPLAGFEHDGKYDAWKVITTSNPELPQLFSYTPSDAKLAVNGMPELATVPVGFTAVQSGTFTISAPKTGDMMKVLLEDLVTGIQTNLLTDSYTFEYTAGENEKRFNVHFSTTGINETEQPTTNNIYAKYKTVYINLPEQSTGTAFIFTLTGQLATSAPVTFGMNKIELPHSGIYMVKILTDKSTLVKKIWIQ